MGGRGKHRGVGGAWASRKKTALGKWEISETVWDPKFVTCVLIDAL